MFTSIISIEKSDDGIRGWKLAIKSVSDYLANKKRYEASANKEVKFLAKLDAIDAKCQQKKRVVRQK